MPVIIFAYLSLKTIEQCEMSKYEYQVLHLFEKYFNWVLVQNIGIVSILFALAIWLIVMFDDMPYTTISVIILIFARICICLPTTEKVSIFFSK